VIVRRERQSVVLERQFLVEPLCFFYFEGGRFTVPKMAGLLLREYFKEQLGYAAERIGVSIFALMLVGGD